MIFITNLQPNRAYNKFAPGPKFGTEGKFAGGLLLADSHLRDSVSGVVDAAFILTDVAPMLANDR